MATKAYQPEPLDVLLAVIPSLPRPVLARLTARMIDRLDEIDVETSGDPDLEPNGDEEDGDHKSEDSFEMHSAAYEAGCPISDPDMDCEDGPPRDDGAPGDPEDAEENGDREAVDDDTESQQMPGDVPSPATYAIEPDPLTGQRQCLGRWGIEA